MARGLSGTGIQGHRYTGTMVQALVLQRRINWRGNSYEELDLPQRRCDPSTIADS